jgi:hypothetical protein
MQLSELITALQNLKAQYGDLTVYSRDGFNFRKPEVRVASEVPEEWDLPTLSVVIEIDD